MIGRRSPLLNCVCFVTMTVLLMAVGRSVLADDSESAGETEPRQLGGFEEASHVLNRLAFGPLPGQVEELAKSDWKRWAETQLEPEKIDDGKLEEYLAGKYPTLQKSITKLEGEYRNLSGNNKARNQLRRDVERELVDIVLLRAVFSQKQFQQVIVEFWRNHFNVDVNKVPLLATDYENNVLNKFAFGKFEDLLMATATHPAMMYYLDNYVSNASNLNENYAREIMELHTLGVDNGYTQDDVINMARTLTGWTTGWQGANYCFYFDPKIHHDQPVTVVGLQLDGQGGQADGERAIRHLAAHPNTARFISLKLCRYLVNDRPDDELVDRIAGVFQDTGGDLRQVYRAIIFSEEFVDSKNYRAKFKTPFEFVVSTLRATDSRIQSTNKLVKTLNLMGQPIYECLEPTGYYDQAEAWLDPGVMIYRWNFALDLVQNKVSGVRIGDDFAEQVQRSRKSASGRPRVVLRLVMPASNDVATEKLVARASDVRVMVAAALGSPGFQQQ